MFSMYSTHQCGHLLRDHAANPILFLLLVVVTVAVVGWNEEHLRDDLVITLVAWWSHVGRVGHSL